MAYTAFDRLVASWRYRVVLPALRPGTAVCDLGCGLDAPFLQAARDRVGFGVGIDYQVVPRKSESPVIVQADIARLPISAGAFDCVLMLAVLEHLLDPLPTLRETFRILRPGGSLILTWPSPLVDPLLRLLLRMRLVSKEVEVDKHVARIPLHMLVSTLREIGFSGFVHRKFQSGLNNLLIARRE